MTMNRIRQNIFCLMLLALAVCTGSVALHAQTSGAGAITGLVTDPSQAVVPDASVTITNIDTGIVHNYKTNSAGIYQAPFLSPGHYKVGASSSGFGKVEVPELTLQVGRTLTINVTLTVKTETTTVEVSSTNVLLDVEQTEVSQEVDSAIIQNLPVNGRNWSDFVLLTPNVVADGGSGLVSFHGISGLYNQNYVDGANNNQMLFSETRGRSSGAPFVYSLDSIKEFQAEASNYSAEFGQAAGGQVNAITKSGTENLHGDLFYYLRYPDLNALDPYSKWVALYNNGPKFLLTQPVHQQNEFGGSMGGPVIKSKLFYFLTFDGFRRAGRALYYETNTVSQAPSGTYSSSTVITPTQCPVLSGLTGAYAYLNGTKAISSTQCTAAINFLLSLQAAPSRFAKETLLFPRVDYQLNSKNLLYANFNFADFDSTNGYSANPTYSNTSPSTNGATSYHERFLIAHWTSTLSNSAVNDLRFQWGRDLETANANAPGPSVGMGAEIYGMPNALPRVAEPDEHRLQFTDVFSKVWNRHSLKFGGDINLIHEVMINLFQGGGIYSYSGTNVTTNFQSWAADAFAGQAGDVDPFAGSHYTTFVQTIDKVNPVASGRSGADDFWMQMYDGFAEDTWKLSRNITVNLGARYDFQLTPAPERPNTSSTLAAEYNTTIKNVAGRVQPRIGFSWNPRTGTVVRGGYGIFTGLNQGSTYYAMRVENGVYQINENYTGCGTSCTAAAALTFPNVPFPVPGPSLSNALYPNGGAAPTVVGVTSSISTSFHGLSPDFVPPLVHEFDLAVEQTLPGKMSLSLGYVGSRGLRLPVFTDANLVGRTPHGLRAFNITYPNGTTKLVNVPYYLATDRINPSLTSINAGFSVANSWYHGMAVTVRRPFDHGLEVLLNYTWSKALDDDMVSGAFGTFFGGNTILDPNNIKGEHGRSDIDMRHRLIGTVLWKPSILEGNPWMKHGLDGFIFSGTATESTGFPIVASMSGTVSNIAAYGSANYAADGNIYGGAMSSSSGASTTGRPPEIQRNSQAGPGVRNIDFRLTREIPIHDKIHMEFIGEAFNLLNHPIDSSVNSTYATYTAPSTASKPTSCAATATTANNALYYGCITPYAASTPAGAFGVRTGTNSVLYGPRQIQVSAKLFF
jgi:hypothetical protein